MGASASHQDTLAPKQSSLRDKKSVRGKKRRPSEKKVAKNFRGRQGKAPPVEFYLIKFFFLVFLDLRIKFGKIIKKV